MRDDAGFDDYCEYCECGAYYCDGSCRSDEDDRDYGDDYDPCPACGSTQCSGPDECDKILYECGREMEELDAEFAELLADQQRITQRRTELERAYIESLLTAAERRKKFKFK